MAREKLAPFEIGTGVSICDIRRVCECSFNYWRLGVLCVNMYACRFYVGGKKRIYARVVKFITPRFILKHYYSTTTVHGKRKKQTQRIAAKETVNGKISHKKKQ